MRAVAAAAAVSLALVAAYLASEARRTHPRRWLTRAHRVTGETPAGSPRWPSRSSSRRSTAPPASLERPREDVVLAFDSRDELERFARQHGIDDDELDEVVRSGLLRAIDDAAQAEALDRESRISCVVSSVASPSESLLGLLPALERIIP